MLNHQRISYIVVIAGLCVLQLIVGVPEFPTSKIERCQAGDTKCLAATMTKVIQNYYQGIPELALAPIDPHHFSDVVLSESGDGPLTMELRISEGDFLGWRHMTISNVVGFDKDPKTSKFEFVVTVPLESIVGKYEIDGKFLQAPLQGKGDLNITYTDSQMSIRLKTQVVTRDDEDYLEIRKVHMELSCKTAVFELGNLSNDKETSDGLNAALNADPPLVFQATRKSQTEVRIGILQKYLTQFFDVIPYRMLFAE